MEVWVPHAMPCTGELTSTDAAHYGSDAPLRDASRRSRETSCRTPSQSQRFTDVLRLVDARLAAQPRDVRLLTIRGIALERLNRLPESLTTFERALAVDPQSLPALKGATEVAYRVRSPKAARLVNQCTGE